MAKRTPEERKAYFAEYYQRNRDKALEYQRQYREARREQIRLAAIEYRRRNPGKRTEWRLANIERDKARDAAYKAANAERIAEYRSSPEVKDMMRAAGRRYRKRHPEKIKEWLERPGVRERAREYQKHWARAHPEKWRASAAARRARLMGVYVEKVTSSEVLKRHSGICGICSTPVDPGDFHVDHIIPLARGGEHSYANTQPAHPICNMRKGARLPEETAA